MNPQRHVIIINGVDKTSQVESIRLDEYIYIIKFQNNEKNYSYSRDKITWLTNPSPIDFTNNHVFINGDKLRTITQINEFNSDFLKYYAVTFDNAITKHYTEDEINIRKSCLSREATNIFNYFKICAGLNTLGLSDTESSESLLSSIYSTIDFIDEQTIASVYLNPDKEINKKTIDTPIFPFGCNASQKHAIKTALTNQISVIQGPPGTGKTQTILNIVANLLLNNKTVLIVSNNNSATENVLEKLKNNGLDFLVAPLGKKDNKEHFIANQPILNQELPSWHKTVIEVNYATSQLKSSFELLESVFSMQERLAICRQELAEIDIEKAHFKQEHSPEFNKTNSKISSVEIIRLLEKVKNISNGILEDNSSLWNRIKNTINSFYLSLHLFSKFKIKTKVNISSITNIITQLEWFFYIQKHDELIEEIKKIETTLSELDAVALMKSLTDNSMIVLKSMLASRYNRSRSIFPSVKSISDNSEAFLNEYPVVLSTTFSSKTNINEDTFFDYVIMDEASQVSVETGLLALTCAKNAVIVGDQMQLPNVLTEEDIAKLEDIRILSNVPNSYDAAIHSFLSSVLATIPNIPITLLREHYRCHPDIINFCNQKFYGGNLLIMTERKDNEKHLLAVTTAKGNHSRGHYNQREIDVVKSELLPLLGDLKEIGIITPYNNQVYQFNKQIPEVEVATVHKFQGREKNTIIMSVTDDIITDFSDNANLLNVAVSRGKDRFCLVVSGNDQKLKGNIHDLIGYITYQQGIVIQSNLRSIYDYLFSNIETNRTISEYDSENITFNLIEKIRITYPKFSHVKTICHYPLRYLVRDISGLSEREAKYALNPSTHIDFLIINRVTKEPILAIEIDGYSFHSETTEQYQRDLMKNNILKFIGLKLLRLSTIGHSEEQQIVEALTTSI